MVVLHKAMELRLADRVLLIQRGLNWLKGRVQTHFGGR